jgi:hypothetical protein
MAEKINASRFCDLQSVDDFNRHVIERKFRGQSAFIDEWHATLLKEGFELKPLRDFPQYKSGKVIEKEIKSTK